MKSDIHKLNIPVVPPDNLFPPHHCSLCPKGTTIDHNSQYKLIDERRRSKAGEILVRQDEAADVLLVIHEGYCKSSVECGDNVFISHFYVPRDIMALDAVEGGKYLTTIKATTTAEVCHANIARLFEVTDRGPSVAAAVIKFLYRNNGFTVEKLQRYTNKHTEARIAALLVKFCEMHLRVGRPEAALRLPFSRDEIANYLDLKIEAVSRSLKSLRQQNPITLHGVRTVTTNSYLGLRRFI